MLELKNISFSVDAEGEKKEIIHNLNLVVEDRKLIVITGPNGGGKSSLAKLIAGIEKPTAGRIFLDGKDITDATVTERAQMGIGFAFQQRCGLRRGKPSPFRKPVPICRKWVSVRGIISIAKSMPLSPAGS